MANDSNKGYTIYVLWMQISDILIGSGIFVFNSLNCVVSTVPSY